MPTVSEDDFDVYYEVHGEGTPLVFLHGGGGNHAAWYQQLPHFEKNYKVVLIDLPGFGLSTVRNGKYDMSIHVPAIEAVVEDLGIDEKVFIVSQSLGGYGSLVYTVDNPDRVAGLVMASTLGPFGEEMAELAKVGRASVAHLSVADFLLTKEFQEDEPARVALFFQLGSFNETGPGRPNRLKATLAGTVPLQKVREAIAAGVQLTVIEGGADVMAYRPAYAKLRELVPTADVRLVEGAPHSDYWENPERFNTVVDEALAKVYGA
ncbi:MAG: alpha/beta hydrolase [Microbacterium sp.]|uniref:alpha/beta fold hydrolase n=1 Tax=Microbacterium sp. TaxID=51671 RepID=UPI0039E353A6